MFPLFSHPTSDRLRVVSMIRYSIKRSNVFLSYFLCTITCSIKRSYFLCTIRYSIMRSTVFLSYFLQSIKARTWTLKMGVVGDDRRVSVVQVDRPYMGMGMHWRTEESYWVHALCTSAMKLMFVNYPLQKYLWKGQSVGLLHVVLLWLFCLQIHPT